MISRQNRNKFLLLVVSFFWIQVCAQENETKYDNKLNYEHCRGNKECRISKGTCKNTIELLRVAYNNDSIAVEVFKQEYKIENMREKEVEWLFSKKHTTILRFFVAEQNKHYRCHLKGFNYPQFPLLID